MTQRCYTNLPVLIPLLSISFTMPFNKSRAELSPGSLLVAGAIKEQGTSYGRLPPVPAAQNLLRAGILQKHILLGA